MTAWGFSTGQWTPYEFAEKASAFGFTWAALELDDYDNSPRWPAFRDECRRFSIAPGVWTTHAGSIIDSPSDAHFLLAEVEGPSDYDSLMTVDVAQLPDVPRAIITNFNTITPERAAPLIADKWAVCTEAYMGDNPLARPDSLDSDAKHRGWSYSVPCFGVWNKPLADYSQWFGWEQGWCLYLAENVLT